MQSLNMHTLWLRGGWLRRELLLETLLERFTLRRACERRAEERCRDSDRDGICNGRDNSVQAVNPSQRDFDLDGRGDACDADDDNDGDPDRVDPAPCNARIRSRPCAHSAGTNDPFLGGTVDQFA